MTDKPPADDRQTRPFADILNALETGRVHRDLSNKLQQLTEAVAETHKDGTLTITLKMTKSKISGAIEIDAKSTIKLPEPTRATSLFFIDKDLNLVRDDPRQGELEFGPRKVEPTTEEAAQ
jgi:hypothetical protein